MVTAGQMAEAAEQLASQPGSAAESSFLRVVVKTGSLLSHLIKGQNNIPKCGKCYHQNTTKCCAPFLAVRGVRRNDLSFTLEGMSPLG